jgi:hypothetical protein
MTKPTKLVEFAIVYTPETVEFTMPIRLVSESNARRHWRERHQRALEQRQAVRMLLLRATRGMPCPTVVRITRLAPSLLDTDNCWSSAKAVRDEIAALFGVADGPKGPIKWEVDQEVSAAVGCKVTML